MDPRTTEQASKTKAELEAAARHAENNLDVMRMRATQAEADKAALIETLFYGYLTLGFDADGCKDGACFLAHSGLGGNNLDAFLRQMRDCFSEARKYYDDAIDELYPEGVSDAVVQDRDVVEDKG